MSLIQMSLSGAILIFVIAILRTLFINRFPKRFFLFLWGIVLVRLLVPFSIPSTFSVYSLLSRNKELQDTIIESPLASLLPVSSLETKVSLNESVTAISGDHPFPIEIVWLIGFLLFGIFFAVCYLTCLRNYKTSLPVSTNFTEKWLKEHPTRRRVSIRQSDLVSSPLTYGLVRPVILLPKTVALDNEQQLNYIFLHEYIHICRFDSVAKLIMIATLCLHWFNPLVWIMYLFFNRDLELACDESVVRKSGTQSRANYARTLVSMEEQRSVPTLLFNSFSKNTIEERIIAIMKPKKITLFGGIAAVALILCIGTCFLTSANAAEPDNSNKVQSQDVPEGNTTEENVATETPATSEEDTTPESVPGIDQNADTVQVTLWIWPTEGSRISSNFGTRVHPISGEISLKDHINIAGEKGDDVYAAIAGTVAEAAFDTEYGNYVVIEGTDGTRTVYGHLLDTFVAVGDEVVAGATIGTLGATGMATGPNLSFGVFVDGTAVDPMGYFE